MRRRSSTSQARTRTGWWPRCCRCWTSPPRQPRYASRTWAPAPARPPLRRPAPRAAAHRSPLRVEARLRLPLLTAALLAPRRPPPTAAHAAGNFTACLARAAGLATPPLAVDFSEDMLAAAAGLGDPRLQTLCLDAVAFSAVSDVSYDRLLLKEVVHHISETDVAPMYAGFHRQLSPGGLALTVTRPQEARRIPRRAAGLSAADSSSHASAWLCPRRWTIRCSPPPSRRGEASRRAEPHHACSLRTTASRPARWSSATGILRIFHGIRPVGPGVAREPAQCGAVPWRNARSGFPGSQPCPA